MKYPNSESCVSDFSSWQAPAVAHHPEPQCYSKDAVTGVSWTVCKNAKRTCGVLITKASEWICEVSNTEEQKKHTGKKTNREGLVGLEAFKDSGRVRSQVLAASLTVPAFTCTRTPQEQSEWWMEKDWEKQVRRRERKNIGPGKEKEKVVQK